MTTSQKAHRPTMAEAKRILQDHGYTYSTASWEDDINLYVFSRESCGPSTYNHPRCTVHWGFGYLSVTAY